MRFKKIFFTLYFRGKQSVVVDLYQLIGSSLLVARWDVGQFINHLIKPIRSLIIIIVMMMMLCLFVTLPHVREGFL